MQVTIDIPEPLYRELESQAHEEKTSIGDVLVARAGKLLPDAGTVRPTLFELNANLNDFIFMSDDEMELFERVAAVDPEAAMKAFGIRTLNADD